MIFNTDPKNPYHYLIGVGMYDLRSKNPGQLFLKYGPLYFTNEEVKRVYDAVMLSEDKLFKTTQTEALEITETSSLVHAISSMKFAAVANNVTIHHFSSSYKIYDEEEYFVNFVQQANTSNYVKDLLEKAKIKG